jgi:hypothetical protein
MFNITRKRIRTFCNKNSIQHQITGILRFSSCDKNNLIFVFSFSLQVEHPLRQIPALYDEPPVVGRAWDSLVHYLNVEQFLALLLRIVYYIYLNGRLDGGGEGGIIESEGEFLSLEERVLEVDSRRLST